MLPRVILHNAVSLDGRMDWFEPNLSLYYTLAARWNENATLVGSNTILIAPDGVPPEETNGSAPQPPDPGDTRPLLVVPDSQGRIRTWHYWRQQPFWRGLLVLVSRATPQSYLDYLQSRFVDHLVVGDDKVDLCAALETLHDRYDVKVVRVDSGGTLNGALLRAGLVDEVSVLIGPALVGGMSARSIFCAPNLTRPEDVIPLKLVHVEQLDGDTVWLRYNVVK